MAGLTRRVVVAGLGAALLAVAAVAAPTPTPATWVYLGSYTGGKSRGISVASFDPATGRLGAPSLAAETANPSFLAVHPTRPLLYAVNEVDGYEGHAAGAVSAFAVDPATGGLRALGQVSSGGASPCHLSVDPSGRNVLVANYGGGSVAVLPIRDDGSLGPARAFVQHTGASVNPRRQAGPHAHMIATDPAGRFALAADLGLDQILVYRVDAAEGTLAPADPPFARLDPGSGPRHFAFSPDGRDLYVLAEMKLALTGLRYEGGRLTPFQTVSALPAGVAAASADSAAEIAVHPNGRFVYTSQRGPDDIAVFARDAATGRLSRVEHVPSGGRTPRGFAIHPSGRWLIAGNQNSDVVVVFAIDGRTGRLTPAGERVEVGSPVSISFFR